MDMICVDLGDHPAAKVGDEVVLWGEDLPVDDSGNRCRHHLL